MTIRGTCESCGKAFRLPAAGRTYECKACGGTVVPEGEEPLAADEPEPQPDAVHHETAREHRERLDARHRKEARKARVIWGSIVLVVAIGAVVAYQLTQ